MVAMTPDKEEKRARNRLIERLGTELKGMQSAVMELTGSSSIHQLHAYFATRKSAYIDLQEEVIFSPQMYIQLFILGLNADMETEEDTPYRNFYERLTSSRIGRRYLLLFLERTYWREYENLSKRRPVTNEAEIWIGQNNADFGLLVTPRFEKTGWENDKSEIRRFRKRYWSIGHVLETGLLVPGEDSRFKFNNIEDYLLFFKQIIVRQTSSVHQNKIAQLYCDFVMLSANKEDILLLIPEFRYGGRDFKHKYRLDFSVIDVDTGNKIGFELSPWSSHGLIVNAKEKSQKQINEEAKGNFEKEMKKHKDYFKKFGIFTMIYTDSDLLDIGGVFSDISKYLVPTHVDQNLSIHLFENFMENGLGV